MDQVKMNCDFCRNNFPFNPEGRGYLAHLELCLCDICRRANSDGVAPMYATRLEQHLEKKGITKPKKNSEGYYILDRGA